MVKQPHQKYIFDEFALDLTRGCLYRGTAQLKLRPKSFEVLKYLLENNRRLIARDEFIAAIWMGAAVVDDSLVQCLKDVRRALGDEAQQLIKTVHGRGYILDVDVRREEDFSDPQPKNSGALARSAAPVETSGADFQNVSPTGHLIRLMVLPFRMLRADSDVDFLAFSVPDAVCGALSVLDSVIVCSPTVAPYHANAGLDLKEVLGEAGAEAMLIGTIMRVGDGIRVTCKLLEVPSGTVLWWDEPHVTMSDLFELQDKLVSRIVDSLSISLSNREQQRLSRDVPATSLGYEYYLRGNELSRRGLAGFAELFLARDLYERSVELDPDYAPAWSQLGRCYRLIGKGVENCDDNLRRAEMAFKRALELNPELPPAHSQYAFLEAELGHAPQAMERLLKVIQKSPSNPDLFVALVLCCRFCGLLDASVVSHERGRQLDPRIGTSVSHTYYQLGDYESALANVAMGSWAIKGMTLGTMGCTAEAVEAFAKIEQSVTPAPMLAFVTAWRAMFEGKTAESLRAAELCIEAYLDPEGVFYMALVLARLGETERALTVLKKSIDLGFSSIYPLRHNSWFDSLRATADFKEIVECAETRSAQARELWADAVGAPQLST